MFIQIYKRQNTYMHNYIHGEICIYIIINTVKCVYIYRFILYI